jgi:uncharacterized membrane protein
MARPGRRAINLLFWVLFGRLKTVLVVALLQSHAFLFFNNPYAEKGVGLKWIFV